MILCLSIVTVLMLSACGAKEKTAKITIISSSWSGFEGGSVTEKVEESYTVKKDESIELGGTEDLTVKILKIADSEVTIETSTPMSDKEDGTINLRTDKTEFKITSEKELKLETPTMDAGDTYIFKLQ